MAGGCGGIEADRNRQGIGAERCAKQLATGLSAQLPCLMLSA
jgi:hypothetical protein